MVVWTRGDNGGENRSLVGSGRIGVNGGDGRCICHVQRSRVVSTTHIRCHVEQRLVFAIRICSHQLHQELGIRMLRGHGLLDRSVFVHDLVAQTARSCKGSSAHCPHDNSLGQAGGTPFRPPLRASLNLRVSHPSRSLGEGRRLCDLRLSRGFGESVWESTRYLT